jgi:hypothetical protein
MTMLDSSRGPTAAKEPALTLPLDRDGDLARHVYDALEDEAAQPLAGLEHDAPEGFESFSELETSLSELSFGYGVAWALARVREPFASSRRISDLAAQAVTTAWRSFSDDSWRVLMEHDRAARAAAAAEPESQPRLDEFMGGLARARSRRPRDEQGETPGSGPSGAGPQA